MDCPIKTLIRTEAFEPNILDWVILSKSVIFLAVVWLNFPLSF